MKKTVLGLAISSALAVAQNYEYKNPYDVTNNSQRYESSTGTKYQYDMNKIDDRMAYRYDLDAQRRDQMNVNPYRSMDRQMGQYGGGISDE